MAMTPWRVFLVAVALAVVSIGATTLHEQAEFDAEHQSAPPHVRPADSGRATNSQGVERTSYVTPFDMEVRAEADAIAAYLAAEEDRKRAEAEEAARLEAARGAPRPGTSQTGASIAVECGNTVLPDAVVQRESGGRCDAYNATGCGGRGCLGYAQVDAGHFAEQSPWNPNVPGTCYGLSYNECVERLWDGGAGAGHWR